MLPIAGFMSHWIYLSLTRQTRRRVNQTYIRRRARKHDGPFILLCRSYEQGGRFTTSVDIPNYGITDLRLIEALIYDLSHRNTVVALGDQDIPKAEHQGRALYVAEVAKSSENIIVSATTGDTLLDSEKLWQRLVLRLAESSRCIVVVPGRTHGVIEELLLLRSGGFGHKTFVFMWPDTHPYTALCADSREWEVVREEISANGVMLPPHEPGGAWVRLNDQEPVDRVVSPIPLRNVLEPVIECLAESGRWLSDVTEVIEMCELCADPERYGHLWGYMSEQREFSDRMCR
ncbi:MAG: hypothetical protein H6814_08895 [Phycisphaeraceae bacterium]|nr:hypothetical protein [Phycisphaeraceae bacterium]